MKRYTVELSDRAESDLVEIYKWVHDAAGDVVADRFYFKLVTAIESLAFFPKRGVLSEEVAPEVRRLVHGNHLILYRVEGGTVLVRRIVHGAIDLTGLMI